jgi:hypothetical protein
MESDGNAAITLFERTVLLEMLHQKSPSISHSFSVLFDREWWELCLD